MGKEDEKLKKSFIIFKSEQNKLFVTRKFFKLRQTLKEEKKFLEKKFLKQN
jgi:hypothetical protein